MTKSTPDVRRGRILLTALAVGLLAAALVSSSAAAGKGSGGGGKRTPSGGTLSITLVSDNNGNGAPDRGDEVRWDVSKTTVTNPYVTTTCSQGGTTVMTTWAGYYPGYMWPGAQTIMLTSDVWAQGPASCTGVLYGTSTTFTFSVGG